MTQRGLPPFTQGMAPEAIVWPDSAVQAPLSLQDQLRREIEQQQENEASSSDDEPAGGGERCLTSAEGVPAAPALETAAVMASQDIQAAAAGSPASELQLAPAQEVSSNGGCAAHAAAAVLGAPPKGAAATASC